MTQSAQLVSGPRLLDAREFQIAREAQASHGSLDKVATTLGFPTEESAVRSVAATLGLDLSICQSRKRTCPCSIGSR